MYYDDKTSDADLEVAQSGMGLLPLLLPLLTTALGIGAGFLQKKPKAPKGPTKEQIAMMQAAAAKEERDRIIKYGLIGLGIAVVIGGGIYMARKKK
jgi:hypothetical protein